MLDAEEFDRMKRQFSVENLSNSDIQKLLDEVETLRGMLSMIRDTANLVPPWPSPSASRP